MSLVEEVEAGGSQLDELRARLAYQEKRLAVAVKIGMPGHIRRVQDKVDGLRIKVAVLSGEGQDADIRG